MMRTEAMGFTLIELLIMVAIIAVLAAMAIPNFLEARTGSTVTHTLAKRKTVGDAIYRYEVDWNSPPVVSNSTHVPSQWFLTYKQPSGLGPL